MSNRRHSRTSSDQWRQYNFFDVQQIRDPLDPTKPPAIFQKPDITSSTSGRGSIILADILFIDRTFNVQKFLAYEGGRVAHMKQMKQKNILLTIGEEDPPVIKIWDLDKQDKSKGTPNCQRTIKVNHGGKPFPVSTLAVLENLSQIAVGLANGVVVLIKGDIYRDRYTKQKVIHESDEPVTGLGFKEHNKNVILFIVTTNKIWTCLTNNRSSATILDDQGCGLGCAVISDTTNEMVVAKDEAIYFYGPEGRGSCYAYEGAKSFVTWFKSNLIIVSPPASQPTRLTASTRSALSINPGNPSQQFAPYELTKVTIFDTTNRFIAYMGTFSPGVRTITCEWGGIYILGMDGKLYRLDEKDTPTKLEILFKKNMYSLAVNLAHSQKYDDASISEIFKKYGDHLYREAKYEDAMTQYIRTIGHLEPSYIIRKFLDAQRIHNLVNYLQKLHNHGFANADHTTLLLNCYTKLKDVASLDQFIKTDKELTFEVETAIRVCRQAGYHEHAVYLAKKFEQHDSYLKIQIEDVKDCQNALEYIRKLGPSEANRNLQKYGKILLNHLPQPTTQLLIDLCTGDLFSTGQRARTPEGAQSSAIINTYAPSLSFLLGPVAQSASAPNPEVPDATITDQQASSSSSTRPSKDRNVVAYRPPPVRTFMSLFIDQPSYLIQFLEQVSQKRWGGFNSTRKVPKVEEALTAKGDNGLPGSSSADASGEEKSAFSKKAEELDSEIEEKKAVWDTLLELYLSEAYLPPVEMGREGKGRKYGSFAVSTEMERVKEKLLRKDKALQLLKDKDVAYDTNQALVLCHLAQFDEGIVYLYEKMKMYEEILRFFMAKDDTKKVIQALKTYGPQEQSLYPLTLTYFSSSPTTLASSTPELLEILDYIDAHNLLPPLQVVQALSQNSVATLDMIKGYMGRRIESERKESRADRKLIKSYREETEKKRHEIEELKTVARLFPLTKCTACRESLDLPAVHFLCRHSYHQRCLPESDRECPECAVQHRTIAEIRRSQERNADKHEEFARQMEEAEDGFSVVADYFSKNTMAFAKLID
ncbi:14103_t:CDS:10 [Acaulospora morrowiae]|uniref:E3 ubiquitin-protein ligase PEP5 n=1 Tax=Acaulospora morrowiae TaxID=94023 RepID=A0A9N8YZG1_9GLOM|nr:14103_t:CDS:10 [Acaulospora morrowiae]